MTIFASLTIVSEQNVSKQGEKWWVYVTDNESRNKYVLGVSQKCWENKLKMYKTLMPDTISCYCP